MKNNDLHNNGEYPQKGYSNMPIWIDAIEAEKTAGVDRTSIYRWARMGLVRSRANSRNREKRFHSGDVMRQAEALRKKFAATAGRERQEKKS